MDVSVVDVDDGDCMIKFIYSMGPNCSSNVCSIIVAVVVYLILVIFTLRGNFLLFLLGFVLVLLLLLLIVVTLFWSLCILLLLLLLLLISISSSISDIFGSIWSGGIPNVISSSRIRLPKSNINVSLSGMISGDCITMTSSLRNSGCINRCIHLESGFFGISFRDGGGGGTG